MKKIKNFKKICSIVMLIILLISFLPFANSQKIQQNNYLIHETTIQKNNETAWEAEYRYCLSAEGIATDSQNNIIAIGPGGDAVIELPYGSVVKYNPDGELIWDKHQTASLFSGLTSQFYNTISSKQTVLAHIGKSIFQSSQVCSTLPIINNDNLDIKEINNHQFLKVTSNDTLLLINKWVRFYDVAVDSNDNIVVVGEIQHRNTKELRDVYIVKYDPDGNVLWDRIFKRYRLFTRDYATGVDIDSNDDIFITVKSKDKETDEYNGWVLKISSENGLKLSESLYKDKTTLFYDISKDTNDNMFIVGYLPNSGQMNVFKYSNNLDLLEQWGLSVMLFEPWAIDVDPDNNVVVVGSVGFPENRKQYIVKFDSTGNLLWSNTSAEYGILFDVVAHKDNITAVTGAGIGNMKFRFYVGLFDEQGYEYKRYLGGNFTLMQGFISNCLDIDNNEDIVVGGFRNYGYYQFFMYIMKFIQ